VTGPVGRLRAPGRRLLVSPAWFVPYDDFRRRRLAGGLAIALDRWDGARWRPTDVPPTVTPGGVVAYPGLGRRREPLTAEPELYRVRFAARGYRTLYPTDDEPFDAAKVGREFLAYPYDDEHPPNIPAEPELVRLLPDPTFEYAPGVRVVHGVVRRAGSPTPVANALVEARGRCADGMRDWRERALCDDAGRFRLSLRWAGRIAEDPPPPNPTETFTLTASERQGRSGQVDIRLPEHLGLTHVIEISE
jgi:hypothetical protein